MTLVMDEPFDGFDVQRQQEVIGFLRDLGEDVTTVLFVTHNQDLADRLPNRIVVRKVDGASVVTVDGAAVLDREPEGVPA